MAPFVSVQRILVIPIIGSSNDMYYKRIYSMNEWIVKRDRFRAFDIHVLGSWVLLFLILSVRNFFFVGQSGIAATQLGIIPKTSLLYEERIYYAAYSRHL
jgi:hypothetical protein